MIFSKAIFLILLLLIAVTKTDPSEEIPNKTTASSSGDDTHEDSGTSKSVVAVVIGVGVTTFIMAFISFYLVRGYRNQQQHPESVDLEATQKVEKTNHTSAQENLSYNIVDEDTTSKRVTFSGATPEGRST